VGCAYFARCPKAMQVCRDNSPPVFNRRHEVRCWLEHELAKGTAASNESQAC
jgi:ABC-type dipeptide/oligopeptide/nickel transport system ATPase component